MNQEQTIHVSVCQTVDVDVDCDIPLSRVREALENQDLQALGVVERETWEKLRTQALRGDHHAFMDAVVELAWQAGGVHIPTDRLMRKQEAA